jgi:hypothetical protein
MHTINSRISDITSPRKLSPPIVSPVSSQLCSDSSSGRFPTSQRQLSRGLQAIPRVPSPGRWLSLHWMPRLQPWGSNLTQWHDRWKMMWLCRARLPILFQWHNLHSYTTQHLLRFPGPRQPKMCPVYPPSHRRLPLPYPWALLTPLLQISMLPPFQATSPAKGINR